MSNNEATIRMRKTSKGTSVYAVFVAGQLRKDHGSNLAAARRHVRQLRSRRSADQIATDRAATLAAIGSNWALVAAKRSDLAALVRAGLVERRVTSAMVSASQRGGNHGLFGGTSMRKVRTAEYRLAQ